MDFDAISIVKFGDRDSLQEFLFANGIQHTVFREQFFAAGLTVPAFPLIDADIDNLDDWLLSHQTEHMAFSQILGLDVPIDLMDVDWNDEEDFYEWLASHLTLHQIIAAELGLS